MSAEEIVLLSKSPLKMEALKQSRFSEKNTDFLVGRYPREAWRPEQPLGLKGTLEACWARIKDAIKCEGDKKAVDKTFVALENGILEVPDADEMAAVDFCVAMVYNPAVGRRKWVLSPLVVPIYAVDWNLQNRNRRQNETFGAYLERVREVPHGPNWMLWKEEIDRVEQMRLGLNSLQRKL